MAMTTAQFLEYMDSAEMQEKMRREQDLEINGDDEFYKAFSEEVERRPIGIPRAIGLRGCLGD